MTLVLITVGVLVVAGVELGALLWLHKAHRIHPRCERCGGAL